jgi:hypothetical protein
MIRPRLALACRRARRPSMVSIPGRGAATWAAFAWAGLFGGADWMPAGVRSLRPLGLRASPSVLGLRLVIVSPGSRESRMHAGTQEQSNVVNVWVSVVRNLGRRSHPPVRACAAVVRSNRPRRWLTLCADYKIVITLLDWLGSSPLPTAANSLEVSQETRRAAAAHTGVRRTQGRPPRAFGQCAGCQVVPVATTSAPLGTPTDPSRQ